jgi:hypothetical protein
MKTKRLLAPCCLLAALAGTPASAAVVTLLDSTPGLLGSSGPTFSSTAVYNAFTFSVLSGSYTISQVDFAVENMNGSTVTVALRQFTPGTPSGLVASSAQATNTTSAPFSSDSATAVTINTTSTGGNNWVVSGGNSYALVFSSSGFGGNTDRMLTTVNDTNYAISGFTSRPDAGWYQSTNGGVTFAGPYTSSPYLKVLATSSSVPDAGPGPALALLLGGLGLRQWRRTRRTGAAA